MPGLYVILCGPNILLCILCLVFVSFVLRYGHFLDISVISCIALLNRYTYVNYRYLYLPFVYSGLSTNTIMKDLNKKPQYRYCLYQILHFNLNSKNNRY